MSRLAPRLRADSHSITLLFRASPARRAASSRRAGPTVDRADVFQSRSSDLMAFWDKEGPFRPAHRLNHIRVPYIRDGLLGGASAGTFSTCLAGKKVLDVGCGAGLVAEGLASFGAQVTGVDANPELVRLARQHAARNPRLAHNAPTYLHTPVEEHCSEFAEHYDAVVLSEVLEHARRPALLVQSCARAARPGGKLFVTTPTRTRAAQLYMIYGFEYVLKIYPKGAHDYNKLLRPHELQYMLELNDCRVASVRGYVYRPLGGYWHWTGSTWFSFAVEAVKLG